MNYKDLAQKNYKRFCALEGSEWIASDYALEVILRLIAKFEVKNILEMGLGIGSISDTVFKYAQSQGATINYHGTEANEFCLQALRTNVEDYAKLHVYPKLSAVREEKFDLIIIDGQDENFREIKKYCKDDTIIFIEGGRGEQTLDVLSIFPQSKYVNVITTKKRQSYSHGPTDISFYVGGGQLFFVNPNFGRKIFWFKEKVATFAKRKIRRFIKR